MPNDFSGGASSASSAPTSTATPSSTPAQTTNPSSSQPAPVKTPAATGEGFKGEQGTPQAPRKFKVPVDGREIEVDESELVRGYGATKAAQRRMDEAARKSQQAEKILGVLERAKTDPKAARAMLTHPDLGLSPEVIRAVGEEMIYEEYQRQQMSPEQRALAEREAAIQAKEAEFQTVEQQREQQVYQQETQQHLERHNRAIVEALTEVQIPKTERSVKRMAEYLLENKQYGLGYTHKQIAELVREDIREDLTGTTGHMSGDELIEFFGPAVANKIRKADLARLRAARNPGQPPPSVDTAKAGGSAPRPEAPLTLDQYRENVRRRSEG